MLDGLGFRAKGYKGLQGFWIWGFRGFGWFRGFGCNRVFSSEI